MTERRLVASAERFWEQVEQGPGPDDCWLWTGRRDVQGYGRLSFEGPWDYAHRVAWTLVNGEPDTGSMIMGRCGHRACVRPEHHVAITAAEAGRYKAKHGVAARGARHGARRYPERWVRGEQHPQAKLRGEQVVQMRARYAANEAPITRLAVEYGVSVGHVWRIVTRQNWRG